MSKPRSGVVATVLDEFERLRMEAARVFTPSAPIDEAELFAGRQDQLLKVIDVVNQRGQHGLIYGDRGVGKTSLANMLAPWLESLGANVRVIAPRVNCDRSDTYPSIWRKVLQGYGISRQAKGVGFGSNQTIETEALLDSVRGEINPDSVCRMLSVLGKDAVLVVVIDEFDTITDPEAPGLLADTIKMMSDYSVTATLVLVGVAEGVDQLIKEHRSIERALVQIHLERMSTEELKAIIHNGAQRLGMQFVSIATERIVGLSQGLPHYTHLLGLHASRGALEGKQKVVKKATLDRAIEQAVLGAQQTIQHAYQTATMSPRKGNLYSDVLLACARAKTDEFGYFQPADIREPLREITGRSYEIANYVQHLANFCDPARGQILFKKGPARRYRLRFSNPLVRPYVLMKGYSEKKLKNP
jgi:Cdc6-like AAA superfamily ATPase